MIKSYEITVERFGHETTYTHVKSIGKSVELAKKCHEFYTRLTPRQNVITRIYCNSTGARTIIYKKENTNRFPYHLIFNIHILICINIT